MGVIELFSKRQRSAKGTAPDVYVYDALPLRLRVQIVHIWNDTLGDEQQYNSSYLRAHNAYKFIVSSLRREYGEFALPGAAMYIANHREELANFFLQHANVEQALDTIELSFKVIDYSTREFNYLNRYDGADRADAAIDELNIRFREHGVGYQFANGEIIRVDSELLHVEAVKPALALLAAQEYAGAEAEFLSAYEHYRHGRMKEALAEALKAFESVMKAICAKRGWNHDQNATSKTLLQVLFDNGLIPAFWVQHFSALRSSLEGGVPPARNKLGGHGQGTKVIEVPGHLVAYVLHLTASAIVFLAQAESALP